MKAVYNTISSVLCIVGVAILEATCFGKYIIPPILTLQYDLELIIFAIILYIVHYFIFDRINMNAIYGYTVGIFEIIFSILMLYILYLPNDLLNVVYFDSIGPMIVQLIIIVSRVIFFIKKHRKRKTKSV